MTLRYPLIYNPVTQRPDELPVGDQLAGSLVAGLSNKNVLINSNISYFQEASSGTLQQVEVYCADQWLVASLGAGATCNWGIGTLTNGEIPGARNFLGFNVVSGTTAAWLGQKVEGVQTLSGGKATVSFWMRANAAGKKVGVRVVQEFGSGGSAYISVEAGVKTLTTGFAKYEATVDLGSMVGKTIGANSYIYLVFDFAGSGYAGALSGQVGLFEIGQAQLERGEFATDYEFQSPAHVFIDCQRFYEIKFIGGTNGTINSANQVLGIGVSWNIEKRATPAVSLVAGSDTVAAFPTGLASFTNIDKRGAIAFKQSTSGSSNAGWYQAVAVNARI